MEIKKNIDFSIYPSIKTEGNKILVGEIYDYHIDNPIATAKIKILNIKVSSGHVFLKIKVVERIDGYLRNGHVFEEMLSTIDGFNSFSIYDNGEFSRTKTSSDNALKMFIFSSEYDFSVVFAKNRKEAILINKEEATPQQLTRNNVKYPVEYKIKKGKYYFYHSNE